LASKISSKIKSNGDKKVLLVFPGKYNAPNPQVPLSLLHLAAYLKQSDFDVNIFDMRTEKYNDSYLSDPLFVGISSMSGHQIRYGLDFARKVRNTNFKTPIVWGGVHPTLLPEQTIANRLVDVVVRGEGEETIVDLAKKFIENQPLDDVNGINYKVDGKIRRNPDRSQIILDEIPLELPYDLIDGTRYPSIKSGRFHIQTSRGCPHRCGFCYNTIFNHGNWRCKSPNRVLDEFENVLEKHPNVRCLDIIDDNYFVDEARVESICRGMIERGIDTKWRADCRFDYMSRYNENFIRLLEKSGCIELNFGAETGSKRLLELIHKDVTPEMMFKSVEKLRDYTPSIEPYVFWMSGLPKETEDDLEETYRVMEKLSAINGKTQHVEICIYTPFPSPMLEEFASDYKLPTSLEEWGEVDVFHFRPPWHEKRYVDKLEAISAVTRYTFYPEARIREMKQPYRTGYRLIHEIASYRWKHKYFSAPIELKAANSLSRRVRGY
jgi:anaerobic magnesium-protoporphyrin IX monomethyl ester cyclase